MSVRSLNKVMLIGNLTRDPELRYTPSGTAVCSIGVATNRAWTTDNGEKKEETEFHRIVAWNKLAELCSQLLSKGRKVFVEGRLQTRTWTGQDGNQRTTTEIVIDDMIVLDSRRMLEGEAVRTMESPPAPLGAPPVVSPTSTSDQTTPTAPAGDTPPAAVPAQNQSKAAADSDAIKSKKTETEAPTEDINPDDIPF